MNSGYVGPRVNFSVPNAVIIAVGNLWWLLFLTSPDLSIITPVTTSMIITVLIVWEVCPFPELHFPNYKKRLAHQPKPEWRDFRLIRAVLTINNVSAVIFDITLSVKNNIRHQQLTNLHVFISFPLFSLNHTSNYKKIFGHHQNLNIQTDFSPQEQFWLTNVSAVIFDITLSVKNNTRHQQLTSLHFLKVSHFPHLITLHCYNKRLGHQSKPEWTDFGP